MLLTVNQIDAGYGFLQILRKVSIEIDEGEYVCLVGPNGSGKTTFLKVLAGHIQPTSGNILYQEEPITGLPGNKIARKGIAYVSESMNLFVNMTVEENLLMGAYTIRDKNRRTETLDSVYQLFKRLKERRNQIAGTMSGGERKMLAIGRGLMLNPTLLMVDEPSFGLAPQMTETVFESLSILKNRGMTILLIEQNVTKTLSVTDRGYVLENGQIRMDGKSADLAVDPYVRKVFLGV